MSDLLPPPPKRTAPSMLDQNLEDERRREQGAGKTSRRAPAAAPAGLDALAEDVEQEVDFGGQVPLSASDTFDAFVAELKGVRRSIRKKQVLAALLGSLEDPAVRAAVIARLARR